MNEVISYYDNYYGECFGCGKTFSQIVEDVGVKTIDDIADIAKCYEGTDHGAHYCHIDCYRDTIG